MGHTYNKRHVQISVSAATVFGLLIGYWLGARQDAGILESMAVWIGFLIVQGIIFSRIDEKYLIKGGGSDA